MTWRERGEKASHVLALGTSMVASKDNKFSNLATPRPVIPAAAAEEEEVDGEKAAAAAAEEDEAAAATLPRTQTRLHQVSHL